MSKLYKFLFVFFSFSLSLFAQQYSISGNVSSAQTGEKLVGANVYLQSTTIGAPTDGNGDFVISAPEGSYIVICSYIGFETQRVNIDLSNNMELDFELKDYEFSLSVTVLADRAKERETPVAFSNIDKKDMQLKLGSQDIPLVLNTTPSVYSTAQGGGSGDARINVRGFDQRNVAIMINGVPVNDMENGWVYWSNWDGVGDATSSIQVQRGLSAVNLATPSIGGTMNVITDPTEAKFGVKYKQEFGSGSFLKSTFAANTGVINGKWAANVAIVRKLGDGVVDKTWTDSWAYYFGLGYNINKENRLELYALGAPQRHGQNSYKQNIAAYSHELAKDLGYSQAALDKFEEAGTDYNQNWNRVSSSYKGKQYFSSIFSSKASEHDRYDPNFINERENFFHKPIMNLNWYSQLSNKLSLYSTFYWSGGHGGGTGTFENRLPSNNSAGIYINSSPSRLIDWDANIAMNRGAKDRIGDAKTPGESLFILRNSVNNQSMFGLISKAYLKINENLKTSFGVDWRTADIDHYREVRDLLGGDYFINKDNVFWGPAGKKVGLGDKLNYFNTNTVDWYGFYAQAEYSKDLLTTYGMAGFSAVKYSFVDHFNSTTGDASGKKIETESDWINGFQVKGGANFRVTENASVYANAGYVSKVPIFDAVINDFDGEMIWNDKNEEFISLEAGTNVSLLKNKLAISGNFYYTIWNDRVLTKNDYKLSGEEGIIVLTNLDANHYGVEFEVAYQPVNIVRLDASASFGNWENTNDADAIHKDYSTRTTNNVKIYSKDLKIGDQPQTALTFSASFFPARGLAATAVVRHYRDHYSSWDPLTRTDPTDRTQSWKAPNYTLVDFHASYDLPVKLGGVKLQLFAHIFNLLDEIYVQDAVDNSKYNSFKDNGLTHSADDAEVFIGLPRTFNLGISLSY